MLYIFQKLFVLYIFLSIIVGILLVSACYSDKLGISTLYTSLINIY